MELLAAITVSIVAAALAGLVARRLRQPLILGTSWPAPCYAETLRHAGIDRAAVVVSGISDWFLKGIDNLRLLRQVRGLAPNALVIVTADTLSGAQQLYREGADYVLIPPALAAEHLYGLLQDISPASLAAARTRQAAELFPATSLSGAEPVRT
jgi:CheY-like chemotaxis protein